MQAFGAGKGSVEVLGSKVNENVGSIDGIILHSHCLCISVDKGSSFVLMNFVQMNIIHLVEIYRNIITWPWSNFKHKEWNTKKYGTTYHNCL